MTEKPYNSCFSAAMCKRPLTHTEHVVEETEQEQWVQVCIDGRHAIVPAFDGMRLECLCFRLCRRHGVFANDQVTPKESVAAWTFVWRLKPRPLKELQPLHSADMSASTTATTK